jgi:ferritin-like metal-binding protein YciE
MTKMSDPRELFVHELGDLLYAENVLVKALPQARRGATDAESRQGFESHLEETRQHVDNLEQVFEKIGQKAKAEKCPGSEGIKTEHDEFMKEEKPSPQVCDLFVFAERQGRCAQGVCAVGRHSRPSARAVGRAGIGSADKTNPRPSRSRGR